VSLLPLNQKSSTISITMNSKTHIPSFRRLATSLAVLLSTCSIASAQHIIYDDFNYAATAGNTSLTSETQNNGIGWDNAWERTAQVTGIAKASHNQLSLYFDQFPYLIFDGSNHVYSNSNRANQRDFAIGVMVSRHETLYASILIRSSIGIGQSAGEAQMRLEFYDRKGAEGNMRANVGIDGHSLFVSGSNPGYSPESGSIVNNVFDDETTYLLVMKRTGQDIFASLIKADGDLNSLANEPTWQVTHRQNTGVTFHSLKLTMNGSTTGLLADELRIATTWNDVVGGLRAVE